MKLPRSTICEQSALYSSREPSTQWIAIGCMRRAILSTHLRRCPFLLTGIETLRPSNGKAPSSTAQTVINRRCHINPFPSIARQLINGAKTFHIGVMIIGMPYSVFRSANAGCACQLYKVAVRNAFRNFPPGSNSWISFLNSVTFSWLARSCAELMVNNFPQ